MLKTIKLFSILFIIMISIPNIYSLKILEPIYTEIDNTEIDVGVVAPGEFFLVSFLLEENEKYVEIRIAEEYRNIAKTDTTQFTPESIFTTIQISEDISGFNLLKLELINASGEKKEVIFNINVTNDVISVITQNYEKQTEYGVIKEITLTVINKSVTTKEITITSDLQESWFYSKNEKLEKDIIKTLPPVSKTDIKYSFIPKGVGDKDIKIFIYTRNAPKENYLRPIGAMFNEFKRSEMDIKINVIKDLRALYSANQYYYPLYGLNSIPVYFFNNIIRILENK